MQRGDRQNRGQSDENSAIGTGPFVLSRYTKGGQVSLEANPTYYAGRPKLDGIERPIILDGGTRFSSYEAGELDIVDVSAGNLDHINSDPKLKED